MGFTTEIFLFVFFPGCLAVWGLCRWLERFSLWERLRLGDWAAVCMSLGFYGWALFDGMALLFLYICVVFAAGRLLGCAAGWRLILPVFWEGADGERCFRSAALESVALGCACGLLLLWLFRAKYWAFFQGVLGLEAAAGQGPAMLGLSFLTFSAISYLADIRRGAAPAGGFLDCLLYLSFFPKVISGPIVLWRDFQPQIAARRVSLDGFLSGAECMMLGFGKKLILADVFGACLAKMGDNVDLPTAWGAVLLYTLQIYYDFSGYSDIALGLARMFGFSFAENFHFPYRSRSITEFWRRWHISLGTWFREYVYIPMGGSRLGLRRTLWNLAVVFALTGLWHGAGWNYILWGAVNGLFVLLERVVREKAWYRKIPDAVKWAGTMCVAAGFWELFRFQSLRDAGRWLALMLGLIRRDAVFYGWQFYFDGRMWFLIAVAVLGAVIPGGEWGRRRMERLGRGTAGLLLREAALLAVFVLSILFMVNSSYSPFIYFQY